MGIGFLHGQKGGGASMNFRVIGGTTAPASPKANDIWVNTAVDVTGWAFSATEPVGSEGLVWITTGAASPVPFNAAADGILMVYPIKASIYTSGAWVAVAAMSWLGGAWVPWVNGILFANGTDNTELTGGWVSKAYSAGGGSNAVSETVDVTAGGVRCILNESNKAAYSTFVCAENEIDVTDFDVLRMTFNEASVSISGAGAVQARLYNDGGYNPAASADVLSTNGVFSQDVEVDVSALTGTYYIGYFMWKWQNAAVVTANMTEAVLS